MTQEAILALVRHGLTLFGGGLVNMGVMTNADLTTGVGGLIAVAGVVWSVVRKYRNKPRKV